MPDPAGRFKGRCHFNFGGWLNVSNLFLISVFDILIIILIYCWEYKLLAHRTKLESYKRAKVKSKTTSLSFCTRFPFNFPGGNSSLLPSVIHAFKCTCVHVCVLTFIQRYHTTYAVLHPCFFFSLT